MKIGLELMRFILLLFVGGTVLSIVTFFVYSLIGIDAEKYLWTSFIFALIFIYILYKKRGWGKGYIDSRAVWVSISVIILFILVIPDRSPEHLHTVKYMYSYGFPFQFLTLYGENNGSSFFISNLFSGGVSSWVMNSQIFGNFFVVYFAFQFLLKVRERKVQNLDLERG
ncbi:hypothetical protein [Halalkalibacter sp. APA_J-10(15)]|uniref:hypothetical protein n=1 Tax=Halalkalibacter sp. APA_J-10(15) TaxID=2933805 RepID=UPI001FF1C06C|nr:hypothetical protein [Halalkalibacter sp. APA_J-10(15)]MCK0472436.1 hypothetical protein [Halalkalibacter sp. APA_J-10(15)]